MTRAEVTKGFIHQAIASGVLDQSDECSQCGERLAPPAADNRAFYATDNGNYCSVRCALAHAEFLDEASR